MLLSLFQVPRGLEDGQRALQTPRVHYPLTLHASPRQDNLTRFIACIPYKQLGPCARAGAKLALGVSWCTTSNSILFKTPRSSLPIPFAPCIRFLRPPSTLVP